MRTVRRGSGRQGSSRRVRKGDLAVGRSRFTAQMPPLRLSVIVQSLRRQFFDVVSIAKTIHARPNVDKTKRREMFRHRQTKVTLFAANQYRLPGSNEPVLAAVAAVDHDVFPLCRTIEHELIGVTCIQSGPVQPGASIVRR